MHVELFRRVLRGVGLLVTLALSSCNSQPQPQPQQGLEVREPWVRAMPPGSSVAVGYAQLRNVGAHKLSIAGLSSPLADRVEMHTMSMEGGQMRMRPVAGLSIDPGDTVVLESGGLHLMFLGVRKPLMDGETVSLKVELSDATMQVLELPVRESAAVSEHAH